MRAATPLNARALRRPALLHAALVLGLACVAALGSAVAHAAGPTGPTGPIGPVGPIGPTGPVSPTAAPAPVPVPAPARAERPTAPRAARASDAAPGNRIEVTGNTATGVRCSGDGAASVNSVDVSGARLEGRTVIVQGRNASDVNSARDCPERTGPPARDAITPGQTNSIRIR